MKIFDDLSVTASQRNLHGGCESERGATLWRIVSRQSDWRSRHKISDDTLPSRHHQWYQCNDHLSSKRASAASQNEKQVATEIESQKILRIPPGVVLLRRATAHSAELPAENTASPPSLLYLRTSRAAVSRADVSSSSFWRAMTPSRRSYFSRGSSLVFRTSSATTSRPCRSRQQSSNAAFRLLPVHTSLILLELHLEG